MNKFVPIATAAALLTTGMASASPYMGYGPQDRGQYYGNGQDDDRYDRYRSTDYAEVLDARPLYREVRVNEPRQECHDEAVTYRDGYDSREDRYNNVAGAVIGGVIGGALGHQVSRGSGRQVATAIGAVIGSQLGQYHARDYGGYGRQYGERVAYEPRCTTYNESRYEQRAEGYDVTYRYHGHIYHTNMPYDPGNRLAVSVDVSPVRY